MAVGAVGAVVERVVSLPTTGVGRGGTLRALLRALWGGSIDQHARGCPDTPVPSSSTSFGFGFRGGIGSLFFRGLFGVGFEFFFAAWFTAAFGGCFGEWVVVGGSRRSMPPKPSSRGGHPHPHRLTASSLISLMSIGSGGGGRSGVIVWF